MDRQFRQNPARFIWSMFCTSERDWRCATSCRNAYASSSVCVLGEALMGRKRSPEGRAVRVGRATHE